jgi:hypothetical protein
MRRDQKLQVSVTKEEKKLIEELAWRARMTVSEYVYRELVKPFCDNQSSASSFKSKSSSD